MPSMIVLVRENVIIRTYKDPRAGRAPGIGRCRTQAKNPGRLCSCRPAHLGPNRTHRATRIEIPRFVC